MDVFDIRILRELGLQPFSAWPRESAGLRFADVARRLGRNLQFVKDRVARMEEQGIIAGYRVFPNLRQVGHTLTVYHSVDRFVPDRDRMAELAAVDGFSGVVWFLDSGLCLNMVQSTPAEGERRIGLVRKLIGDQDLPRTLYHLQFPQVDRTLTRLDWRIIRSLWKDARRPLSDVAADVGVTAKTARSRFRAMWDEGSLDTHVVLDFERMSGLMVFQLAIWFEEGARKVEERVVHRFGERYLGRMHPPADGYCSFILRIFAFTPAEVQELARQAIGIDGVRHAQVQLATGSFFTDRWLSELLDRQAGGEDVAVPESRVAG